MNDQSNNNNSELKDQTAFLIDGIPTPSDQEDITATDMISDVVEQVLDQPNEATIHHKINKKQS